VTVILVGAIIVGRITLAALGDRAPSNGAQRFDPKVAVRRGDELGTFHLGSTVIVLVPPGADLSCDRGPVRYGASLVG
jgi:phosphatidylserine decarboxylase